jgi:thiosulfate/3-mercaptopyruvate sulfurtransferase
MDPIVTSIPDGAVLADVRFGGGRTAYENGHLPGAAYVDLETVLSDPSAGARRHDLPSPEVFAAGLSAAGIGDGDAVVAYDDAGGVIAARLVWMLRVLGVDAGLLEAPGPLTSTDAVGRTATFSPRRWPADRITDIDHLDGAVLLDARPATRFHGAPDALDAKAGHIPGAVSFPCRENVGLTRSDLVVRLAAVGVGPETDVVSSCGSGVTACHTLLVLEQVGYAPGRLYPGSFSEWSRSGRPIES